MEGASFARIQCTPDLQPTDVTGLSVFNQRDRDFEFRPGPVFANVLLVDEINRAMPKTQSALLEAMAEYQATIDGVTRELPKPFLVLATENPIEQEGTFPLPEAQLDRFLLRTALGYPAGGELRDRRGAGGAAPAERVRPVLSLDEVNVLREPSHGVYIDQLLGAGRSGSCVQRARRRASRSAPPSEARWRSSAGARMGTAPGREYVTPVDIERLFLPVVMHRIVFTPSTSPGPRDRLAAGGRQLQSPLPRARAATGGGAGAGGLSMKLVALAAIGLALAGGVAAASSQADVTLAMRQYTNASKVRVFVWNGQVATAAAGEDVEVLGRDCLTKSYRLYAATRTVSGGGWEVESASIQSSRQLRLRGAPERRSVPAGATS